MNKLSKKQMRLLETRIEDLEFGVRFLKWCEKRGISNLKDIYDIGFIVFFDELHSWNGKVGYSVSNELRSIFADNEFEVPEYSPKTIQIRKRLNEINAVMGQLTYELEKEMEEEFNK